MANLWYSPCRWTRARLPLLAGGDLIGAERRQVERHLIGCPSCRARLAEHRQALDVLATVAQVRPERPNAPSLWPALARQLREERHPVARTFAWGLGNGWSWTLPTAGLALAASALVAVGLAGMAYHAGTSPLEHARGLLAGRPAPATKTSPVVDPPALPIVEPETKPLTVADESDLKSAENVTIDTGGTR